MMNKQMWVFEFLFLIPASIGGYGIYWWINHDIEGFLVALSAVIFLLPLVLLYIFKNPDAVEDGPDKWAEEVASWQR